MMVEGSYCNFVIENADVRAAVGRIEQLHELDLLNRSSSPLYRAGRNNPAESCQYSSKFPDGLVVRIRRSHRRGPGSIPGQGRKFFCSKRPKKQIF
jgi:hypothetical protein